MNHSLHRKEGGFAEVFKNLATYTSKNNFVKLSKLWTQNAAR